MGDRDGWRKQSRCLGVPSKCARKHCPPAIPTPSQASMSSPRSIRNWDGLPRRNPCSSVPCRCARKRYPPATRTHKLYETLLGQFTKEIEGKHLLIVPSGPLTGLPLNVLVTKPPTEAITA